jgi:membrane-associated phospholipid phosphatase
MPAGSSSSLPSRPTWRRWTADLPRRVRAIWPTKLLLAVLATLGFCVPYFLLGNFPVFPVRELPVTALDRAAGFHPGLWVWVYQSIYLPINVIPWLTERREDLARYAKAFSLLCVVSFAVFLFFPIRAPKPVVPDPTGMYWFLQLYDVPVNSLPSLHAGLLVMTLLYARRILAKDLPRGLGAFCVTWALLILYSTIATKEHYAVDILAGTVLGWLAHAIAWRRPVPSPLVTTAPDHPLAPRVEAP